MREQTPDLKSFGRVDAALAAWNLALSHRCFALCWDSGCRRIQRPKSASAASRVMRRLATVFPQHAEKIAAQVLSGKPQVEGIGCASCHLIKR